jgi:uncharacterized lipoprotein YmbA
MSRRALPLLIVTALLAAGCFGGKTPVTTVWTLPAPRAEAPGIDPDGPALGVERFSSLAELRTTALTYREGQGRQLKRYPYHQWSDYPDRLLHERLIARLLSERSFKSVTAAPPAKNLDGVLSVRLVEFDEWDESDGVSVSVALRWTLTGSEGELLGAELARAEAMADKDVETIVAAYEEAVAATLDQVTKSVSALLHAP